MGRSARVMSIIFGVVGVTLTAIALLLLFEARRLAASPDPPEVSTLWRIVAEGVIERFIPDPGAGRVTPPAEAARAIARGITGIAAMGGFFLVGAGFAARRAARLRAGE